MLDHVASLTSSLFSEKPIQFEFRPDPSLPEKVVGDRERVEQVVFNLLSNASKFTSEGKVELKAQAVENAMWRISVRDTGAGIAPHQLELIFEPFRQVDGTSTRQFAGTGLGLSIVRELCRLMRGFVRVESEVGQGSTFIVELPIDASDSEPITQPLPIVTGQLA
jgi:signal transduction histidine kinase